MENLSINKDILIKILRAFDFEIDVLICNILNDSETDPHYSAVTAKNYIMWYIEIMNNINEPPGFSDCRGYFEKHCLPDEDYKVFEKKRIKESKYYIGEQY
ncbi:MAG: hypothetical protein FWF08_08250 [Oscillospiraceae bacterium]|nr:hypothetical protein [Oscillospiraceae bacterium]